MRFPRVVWVLLDGLPHELVRAYVRARPASGIAGMWSAERTRPLAPLSPNCQTPPSLFTIWSGRGPADHRMLGYHVPTAFRQGRAHYVDAFEHWPRDLPLVWDMYAANGQRVRTCAVPFVQPERLAPWLLSATHVFGPAVAAPAVLGNGDTLRLASGAQLQVSVRGRELALHQGARCLWAVPAAGPSAQACAAVSIDLPGETHRRMLLRAASIDGATRILCLGYHAVQVTGAGAGARRAAGEDSPYVAGNPGKLYKEGRLGRRADEGGDGQAEHLLLRLMQDVHASFAADALWAVAQDDADLVVAYNPVIDLLGHQVLRQALDGDALAPASAAGVVLMQAMGLVDRFIQDLQRRLPPDAYLVINSDHGMSPIAWDLHPNTSFARRGLLALDGDGQIATESSAAFYHPAENGLLVTHPERLARRGLSAQGVLAPLNEELARAGLPALQLARGVPSPVSGEWCGDQYLHAPRGVRLCADVDKPLLQESRKGGDHTTWGADPWLQGVLMWSGPDLFPTTAGPLALEALLPAILQEAAAAIP